MTNLKQHSEINWKEFVDYFPDPIAKFDKHYKHLYINHAIELETGLPADELLGKSNRDLKIPNDPAYVTILEKKIQSVFDTGKPTINYTQHLLPSGLRYYYMKLIPDMDRETNEVKSVWAVTREITQLKEAELALKEAELNLKQQNIELNQLNADLDTFFYTISHDLRSPLNNIKGILQVLNGEEYSEHAELIKMLNSATERASDVLTGLAEILELKNKQEQVEEVKLQEVLKVVLTELKSPVREANAQIDSDFSKAEIIHYSGPYLESVFRNMINNAIKYRAPNRPLHLTISSWQKDDYTVVSFKDNGQGMDLNTNQNKIFKPFYQINEGKEGKGMGLSIVKNILEKNGGKIEVVSAPDSGTTFICYFKEVHLPK